MKNVLSIPKLFMLIVALVLIVGGCKKNPPTSPVDAGATNPLAAKPQPCPACPTCPVCPKVDRSATSKPTVTTILCKHTKGQLSDSVKCPDPTALGQGWSVDLLGGVNPSFVAGQTPTQQWCSYTYQGPRTAPIELISLVKRLTPGVALLQCAEDKTHAVPLNDVPPSVKNASENYNLYKLFSEQAGFLTPKMCRPNSPFVDSNSPVLVAVIDTAPQNLSAENSTKKIAWGKTSTHGTMLATLIREFSGTVPPEQTPKPGETVCAAEVLTVLGLNKVTTAEGVTVNPKGGDSGTESSVAAAINDAVLTWKSDEHSQKKLIINLSIGWEPEEFAYRDMGPVYDALVAAVGEGALVIAAAGNRPTKQQGKYQGLMYPAGYAKYTYSCMSADDVPIEGGCPLVIPVSGVDLRGFPLPSTRTAGRTLLVAPAQGALGNPDHLQSPKPDNAEWNSLTGSSVAAAVVTAKAAHIWANNPGLSPHLVMDKVWASALPNEPEAFQPISSGSAMPDVCHGTAYANCNKTIPRTVGACRADANPNITETGTPLQWACTPKSDPDSKFCRCGWLETETTPTKMYTFESKAVTPNETKPWSTNSVAVDTATQCGTGHQFLPAADAATTAITKETVCPEQVYNGFQWPPIFDGSVNPLPTGCGCDECSLVRQAGTSNFTLTVRVPTSCVHINSPLISLTHATTQATRTVGLPAGTWSPGQSVIVTDLTISDYNLYNQAVVVGTTEEETVIMDQIAY